MAGTLLESLTKVGIWSLPLMLNGDSSSARGYDIPLTGTTDIPVDKPGVLLYRGIAAPRNVFDQMCILKI